jgi:hypothetical protein
MPSGRHGPWFLVLGSWSVRSPWSTWTKDPGRTKDQGRTKDHDPRTEDYLPMAFQTSALVCGMGVVCTEM